MALPFLSNCFGIFQNNLEPDSLILSVFLKMDSFGDLDSGDSVRIKPFNMRYVSLENFPVGDRRSLNRVAAINRFKEDYLIKCPFKSLSLLRKILQDKINSDIKDILRKYRNLFLKPVFDNISENLKDASLATESNINALMHQILEEAKKMFPVEQNNLFFEKLKNSDTLEDKDDNGGDRDWQISSNHHQTPNSRPRGRPKHSRNAMKAKTKRKRKVSAKNVKDKNVHNFSNANNDKWDPTRLTTKTLFVLGSKANKALGFGAARGRLYSKHSELFRYVGDHEDKEWLHKNQLMPPTGGKAYLLVKDDIVELMNSTEYRNTPGVNLADMGDGFTVPQSMIEKITDSMNMLQKSKLPKESSSKIIGKQMNRFLDDIGVEESNQLPMSQMSSASDLSFIDSNEINLPEFNN